MCAEPNHIAEPNLHALPVCLCITRTHMLKVLLQTLPCRVQAQEHQALVTELQQQLLASDQALSAAQQAAQRQHEEQQHAAARLSALQADCSRLQGQLDGQAAVRRAAEDQVRLLRRLMYLSLL